MGILRDDAGRKLESDIKRVYAGEYSKWRMYIWHIDGISLDNRATFELSFKVELKHRGNGTGLHIPIGYFIEPIDNNNDNNHFTTVQLRWHLSIIFAHGWLGMAPK